MLANHILPCRTPTALNTPGTVTPTPPGQLRSAGCSLEEISSDIQPEPALVLCWARRVLQDSLLGSKGSPHSVPPSTAASPCCVQQEPFEDHRGHPSTKCPTSFSGDDLTPMLLRNQHGGI